MQTLMDAVPAGNATDAVNAGRPAGDCLRACVASVLDLDLDDVPHFVQYVAHPAGTDAHLWWWALVGFCAAHGWKVRYLPEPEPVPGGWALADGMSPRAGRRRSGDVQGVSVSGRHVIFDDRRSRAWMVDAACAAAPDLDPAVFFPELSLADNGGRSPVEMVAEAKAVCRACPVLPECREYGMGEDHGVWGATTPDERKRIRRDRRNATAQPGRAARRKTVA